MARETIPADSEVVWQRNWHSVKLQTTAINLVAFKSIQVASESLFAFINGCKMPD